MDAAFIDEIESEDLIAAYRAGIFPMAESADDPQIFWVDPELRGIIPLDNFHIPASLKKALKKQPYRVTINHAFDEVIASCAAATPVRSETWINPMIAGWFKDLHRKGHAHSVECWDSKGELAGGLYGLEIAGAFFGESMFSRMTDASKIALVHLVARLKMRGFTLLDCQFVNEHLKQFGCVEIGRDAYHSLLSAALSSPSTASFVNKSPSGTSGASSEVVGAESDWASLAGFLQSSTVTS
jgi:leucyl/phenylalanyl-tRNA---protein transferase